LLVTSSRYIIFDMHMEDQQSRRSGSSQRPIGYWLKHLDRLIEHTFEQTLGQDGLTRRHWQVLTALTEQAVERPPGHAVDPTAGHPAGHSCEHGVEHAELRRTLAPFLTDDPDAATRISDDLIRRGWVIDDGQRLRLTDPGRRARNELLTKVAATRRRTVQGIEDDEYLATIDVLRRMASNLEDLPADGH
jgi:DNA-binding MarR family transcriptional regulator